MKILIVFRTILYALLCLQLVSCSTLPKKLTSQEKGLFWKIRSGNNQLYLLGSIHVAREDLYPLPFLIEEGFEASDILVVEADIGKSEIETKEEMAFIVQAGSGPDEHTLTNGLSPKTYALAKKKLKNAGLDIRHFNRFKPWVVAFTLTGVELQRLGFKPEFGIDYHFIQKAQGTKKIVELEGIREQIAYLNDFSTEEQEQFLLYTLVDLERFETQIEAMFRAWSRGDAKAFDRMIQESFTSRPELASISEKLVNQRNKTMLVKIESFLKEKKNFFVVIGAGHLVGEEGIVSLLKQKGYTVEQW